MYNILVVDDESVIRKNICKMVEQCMGIEVNVFQAADGNQALELSHSTSWDIVITDIKMSQMDGLDLIQNLTKQNQYIQFIIISGFSEFEYAQRAIEYKVLKYLLKPINRFELERTLHHAFDIIKSHEEASNTSRENAINARLMIEQALSQLITSTEFNSNKVIELLSKYGINFAKNYFVVMILDSLEKNLYASSNQAEIKSNQRTQADILLSKHFSNFFSFYDYQSRLVIILNLDATQDRSLYYSVTGELINHIRKLYYPTNPIISVSTELPGLTNIPILYREAVHALSYKIVSGTKQFFFVNELKNKKDDLKIPVKLFSMLKESIETNNKIQVGGLLDELFNRKLLEEYSIESIKMLYDNLLNYIFLNVINQNPNLRAERNLNHLFTLKFEDFHNINEIILNIKKAAYFISDELSKQAAGGPDLQVIQKAIAFIHNNYNKNISMSSVANHVCISYNHFSKIFKEEIGENFIDYITNLRIERAKELLKDSTLDIKEIGEILGYSSSRHFSKLFSQCTGMLPSNYRKKIGINDL